MGSQDIAIRVTAQIGGLTSGLADAAKAVQKSGDSMSSALASVGGGAMASSAHVSKLTGALDEYKREQIQGARTARFFCEELAGIIPGAEHAAGATSKLADVFGAMTSFAPGAIAAGVIGGLSLVSAGVMEQEKRALELRQVWRDTAASIEDSLRGVGRALEGSVSKITEVNRKIADNIRAEGRKAANENAEAVRSVNMAPKGVGPGGLFGLTWRDVGSWLTTPLVPGLKAPDWAHIDSTAEKVVKNYGKTDATIGAAESMKPQIAETQKEETLRTQEALDRELLALEAATRDEIRQIRVKLDNDLELLDLQGELSKEQRAEKEVSIREDAARRIMLIEAQRTAEKNAKLFELESQFHDEIWRAEQSLAIRVEKMQVEQKRAGTPERIAEIQKEIDAEVVAANKKIDLMKRTEAESLAAKKRTLAATAPGASADAAIFAELQNKIEAEKNKLAEDANEKERQRSRDRIEGFRLEAEQKLRILQAQNVRAFIDPIMGDFQGALNQMIDGTFNWARSIEEIILGVFQSIGKSLISLGIKAVGELLATQIGAAVAGTSIAKAAAISTTSGHIAEAAAGAAASQAWIPGLGPILAAGAAEEMIASLSLMTAPLLAAKRGFDIPSGLNPIVQAHQREMILPEEHADTIREMGKQRLRGGPGGDGGFHLHVNGPALVDEPSMRRFVESEAWQRATREARRNGR